MSISPKFHGQLKALPAPLAASCCGCSCCFCCCLCRTQIAAAAQIFVQFNHTAAARQFYDKLLQIYRQVMIEECATDWADRVVSRQDGNNCSAEKRQARTIRSKRLQSNDFRPKNKLFMCSKVRSGVGQTPRGCVLHQRLTAGMHS